MKEKIEHLIEVTAREIESPDGDMEGMWDTFCYIRKILKEILAELNKEQSSQNTPNPVST